MKKTKINALVIGLITATSALFGACGQKAVQPVQETSKFITVDSTNIHTRLG